MPPEASPNRWESAKVSHKRVFALLTPEIHSYEMAQMLQKPVFALPGCQRMSVNTLLCDTLGLAEQIKTAQPCGWIASMFLCFINMCGLREPKNSVSHLVICIYVWRPFPLEISKSK